METEVKEKAKPSRDDARTRRSLPAGDGGESHTHTDTHTHTTHTPTHTHEQSHIEFAYTGRSLPAGDGGQSPLALCLDLCHLGRAQL